MFQRTIYSLLIILRIFPAATVTGKKSNVGKGGLLSILFISLRFALTYVKQ